MLQSLFLDEGPLGDEPSGVRETSPGKSLPPGDFPELLAGLLELLFEDLHVDEVLVLAFLEDMGLQAAYGLEP